MAEFPIRTTERSLPGVSGGVRGNLDFDTGGQYTARAVSQAGGVLQDVGSAIFRQQGEAELIEKMAANQEKLREMYLRFDKNTDESTYQDDFEQTWSELEQTEVKNGWARQRYQQAMPNLRTRQQALVDEAVKKRVESNWNFAYTHKKQQAIESNNLGIIEPLLQSGKDSGFFTQDFVDEERRIVRRLGQRRELAALAANEPDAILELDTWDKMHGKYPWLIPEDHRYVIGLAEAAKGRQKRDRGQWWNSVLEDTLGKARTMNPDEFRSQLEQTPGLSEKEKLELLDVYLGAEKLWQTSGVNPYRQTQDYQSLVDTILKVQRNEIVNSEEINLQFLKGKKPNWSFDHWRMVHNIYTAINGESGAEGYEDLDPQQQDYIRQLTDLYTRDEGKIEDGKEYVTSLQQMNEILGKTEPAKRAKAIEPILVKAKETKAKWWLTRLFLPQWKWPKPTLTNATEVESHEAAKDLPSGTAYVIPGDPNVYRKK